MEREVLIPDEVIFTQHAEQFGSPPFNAINWSWNHDWFLQQTLQENIALKAENNRLKAENNELRNRNKVLEVENQKLFEIIHLGCDTSGISSSKDWKKNGVSKELENTTDSNADQDNKDNKEPPLSVTGYLKNKNGEKRRPGSQKNHPPAFMRIADVQEREPVLHYPDKCTRCPHLDQCIKESRFRKYFTAHGYDIEVILVHKEHLLFEATNCLHDGSLIHDDFPEVIGSKFYEMNVQLHVLTWHHIFHGSYDRIALAAKELLGLSLSTGTANAIIQRVSSKIFNSGFMDALRFFILLLEKILGVDETSACVNGRNAWVHTMVSSNATLLIAHWRRGYEGMIYAGVLQYYVHTLISDCWASYFKEVFKYTHAICNSHILRELVAAAYFRHQSWAIKMFDLLLELYEDKRDAIEQGIKAFSQEYIDDIRARYQQIVRDGFIEIAGETKGKSFSLLDRLKKLEDAALVFAVDFDVDFSNNKSEQSLRNLKVALRVIGQFRTMSGLVDYCVIQSFMDTCRKQGHNPYDMMQIVLSGGDIIEAVFGVEKAPLLKQMIRLTDAVAAGDTNEINAIKAEIPIELTEELYGAVSYGRLKPYKDSPPPIKISSSAVPKDKMQAARENILLKKSLQTTSALSTELPQDSIEKLPKNKKQKARASPKSA
jgi:hypothetical protein